MFCEKCGKQNDDRASFCRGCGTALQGVIPGQAGRRSQSAVQTMQQPVQMSVKPAKQRSMAPLFVTLSVVTVLCLAGGGIALGVHLSNERKAEEAAAKKAAEEALEDAIDDANDGAETLFVNAAMALCRISLQGYAVEDGCYIVRNMNDVPEESPECDASPGDPDMFLYAVSCDGMPECDGFAVCVEGGHITGALCSVEGYIGAYPCEAEPEDAEDAALDEDTLALAASEEEKLGGYVDKSRVHSMNANAKSLYNCVATALVEKDSEGVDITQFDGVHMYGDCAEMDGTMYNYFNALEELDYLFMYIVENGCVTAAWVTDGSYAGGYPTTATVDNGTPASFTVWDVK